jgi:hypothetical protein
MTKYGKLFDSISLISYIDISKKDEKLSLRISIIDDKFLVYDQSNGNEKCRNFN